ncbi:MAG: carboxymuconolactone decarboxylase family protein [Acidimicrobiales bacterium]
MTSETAHRTKEEATSAAQAPARRQRISYVPYESMTAGMQAELQRCAAVGTPRPESSSVRAHVPAAFWMFARAWDELFRTGVCDHAVKELCRVYVSRSVKCEYCGNQRSEQARSTGVEEGKYDDLLNFERSDRYDDREKAALAYTEAITWRLPSTDEMWERLDAHFSEPELVELGCFVGLTLGQQSWLRLLDIEHHEVLAGTEASMAPGFGTARALAESKASPEYWARRPANS